MVETSWNSSAKDISSSSPCWNADGPCLLGCGGHPIGRVTFLETTVTSFTVASSHVIRKSPHGTEAKKMSVQHECQAGHTTDIKTHIGVPRIHCPNTCTILTNHLTGQGPTTQPPLTNNSLQYCLQVSTYHPTILKHWQWCTGLCGICGLCHSVNVWLSSSLSLYSS